MSLIFLAFVSKKVQKKHRRMLAISWVLAELLTDYHCQGPASHIRMPGVDQVRDRTTRCIVLSIDDMVVKGRLEKVSMKLIHICLVAYSVTKRLHLVTDDVTKSPRLVILRDDWVSTKIDARNVVNLIGDWDTGDTHVVPTMFLSTTRNIIIVHPDLLVPATSISSGSRCSRKPLLSSLVKSSSSDVTPSTVWGLMLHEVVQSCLATGKWDDESVEASIDEVIRSSLDRLVQIRIGFDVAKSELGKRSKGLAKFSELYISPTPKVLSPSSCLSCVMVKLIITTSSL